MRSLVGIYAAMRADTDFPIYVRYPVCTVASDCTPSFAKAICMVSDPASLIGCSAAGNDIGLRKGSSSVTIQSPFGQDWDR
jgi:hypothetical protein